MIFKAKKTDGKPKNDLFSNIELFISFLSLYFNFKSPVSNTILMIPRAG